MIADYLGFHFTYVSRFLHRQWNGNGIGLISDATKLSKYRLVPDIIDH